jgi:hypothetical protein
MGSPLIVWGRQKRIVDVGRQTHASVLCLLVRLLICLVFKYNLKSLYYLLLICRSRTTVLKMSHQVLFVKITLGGIF